MKEKRNRLILRQRMLLQGGLVLLALWMVLFSGMRLTFAQGGDDLFSDEPVKGAAPAAAAPVDPQSAQPGGSPAPASTEQSSSRGDNYLVWMIRSLGPLFTIVFAFLSLAMVALVVMNLLAVRRASLVPEELVRQFGELLDENRVQEAYHVAKEDESLLGRVLSAGFGRLSAGTDKAIQSMQDVGQEETMRLEHQIGYLALIGNLAPMIGLFGTVVGMIDSFQVIAAGGAAPSPQKLAEGIATALFTTEVGLAIALPALAFYDLSKNRLARYVLELGIVCDNFISRFSTSSSQK